MNVELPPTQDSAILTAAAMSMNLAGSTTAVALNDVSITLDDTTIKGSVSLPDLTAPSHR